MKLEMKRIFCHGKDRSKLHMSLKVEYGFQGEMYSDTLSLTFDGSNGNTYLTAKVQNPGTGAVANRIIEVLSQTDRSKTKTQETMKPLDIVDKLVHYFELKYDEKMLREALSRLMIS